MGRTKLRFTVEDYRALPELGPRRELIAGELVSVPSPSRRHQDLVWELGGRLRAFVRGADLGYVGGSPLDVFLGEHDVVQPDLLVVTKARLDRLADDGVHGAPDLVVEVLSPSTRQLDVGSKKRLYARHGVREYWIVDAHERTITVHDLEAGADAARAFVAGQEATSSVLPGFTVDVSDLLASA